MTAPAVVTERTRTRNEVAGIRLADLAFLRNRSPVYQENLATWRLLERRARAGHRILEELYRFKHETKADSAGYSRRRAMATYQNFPELFATITVGHVFAQAPSPGRGLSYGTLGSIRRAQERVGREPSRAELFHYNADGVGNDGSQLSNFVSRVARMAMHTGHRWVFTEAPSEAPRTMADELAGRRPYWVHWSPTVVQDWEYEDGRLAYAIVRVPARQVRARNGEVQDTGKEPGYYLMVREGWDGFGEPFTRGGWWRFDPTLELLGRGGAPWMGNWSRTGGEIPLSPLFYLRDEGDDDHPAISRSGTFELSQLAVADMNMESAADHDAWSAAASLLFVLGVTPSAFNEAIDAMDDGSLAIPVPADSQGTVPQIYDSSAGAVAADVFNSRAQARLAKYREITSLESIGTPDASGASKLAGFAEAQGPKLSLLASEVEQTMNAHLRWLEMRWGTAGGAGSGLPEPSAVCTWPRTFDLVRYADKLQALFNLFTLTGAKAPTFTGKALRAAAEREGLVTDDAEGDQMEAEVTESLEAAARAEAQDRAALEGGSL